MSEAKILKVSRTNFKAADRDSEHACGSSEVHRFCVMKASKKSMGRSAIDCGWKELAQLDDKCEEMCLTDEHHSDLFGGYVFVDVLNIKLIFL